MTPYVCAIDDMLPYGEFELLREYTRLLDYQDREGPDGVVYAGISDQVPDSIKDQLTYAFTWVMGARVALKICAFRLSIEGTKPPQWAHSDLPVSRFASFLYINPCPGGTVLLRHKDSGMFTHPKDDYELGILQRDQNSPEKWDVVAQVDCAPNRALIIRSDLIHAAIPMYGYGSGPADGRLILWSFFD